MYLQTITFSEVRARLLSYIIYITFMWALKYTIDPYLQNRNRLTDIEKLTLPKEKGWGRIN